MSATRCPRQHCGARLTIATNGAGRAIAVCEPCARNRAGRCRDCPALLDRPTALRCAACQLRRNRERAKLRSRQVYATATGRAHKLKQQRAYSKRPEVVARRREQKKAFLARNPGYMTAAMWKYRRTPHGNAKSREVNRRSYRRHADRARAYARRYYWANREQLLAKDRARRQRRRAQERAA